MKFTVHAENPPAFRQALASRCDIVRYGADLCEFKLPNDAQLREFVAHLNASEKEFCYVCPRVPEHLIGAVDHHLGLINEATTRPVRVVANDWGVLNILIEQRYPNLIPYLGRQLVAVPHRGRPSMAELMGGENLFKRMAVETFGGIVFNKTNMHFKPTIRFLRAQGVVGVDIDWVPPTFSEMRSLAKEGLSFSVHYGLVIVAVVRRCHTARYFAEPIPEKCTMPCFKTAFTLKHPVFGALHMDGNTIYDMVAPSTKDLRHLDKCQPLEVVFTMGPMTRLQRADELDAKIADLKAMLN